MIGLGIRFILWTMDLAVALMMRVFNDTVADMERRIGPPTW